MPDPNRDRKGAASRRRCERRSDPPGPYVSATGALAYLITFPTYGTWLHGDERGSVDRDHNIPGTPMLEADPTRRRRENERLQHPPVELNAERRAIVQRTIIEVAEHRGWTVHALSVRTNHVHVVVSAADAPEQVMNAFKSWSTRRMVEAGTLASGTKTWVRHGSTRYLWKIEALAAACRYVCEGQGDELPQGDSAAP